jgi:hypothetical protein
VFGAWSARARPGAQVSTPFAWDELDAVHPDELTLATVPERVARLGDPWEGLDAPAQSLQPLLDLYERDLASGLQDAPWPPVYPKMPGEPPRVAPSRARKPAAADGDATTTAKKPAKKPAKKTAKQPTAKKSAAKTTAKKSTRGSRGV